MDSRKKQVIGGWQVRPKLRAGSLYDPSIAVITNLQGPRIIRFALRFHDFLFKLLDTMV